MGNLREGQGLGVWLQPSHEKRVNLLLVEDNEDHIELILKAMKLNGILNDIYVVRNGEEALDFLYKRELYQSAPRPGLILLDIKLPKLDGYEVLSIIKKDQDLKTIPVIILTTSALETDLNKCYILGANSYIIKPIQFRDFVQKVRQIPFYWVHVNKLEIK